MSSDRKHFDRRQCLRTTALAAAGALQAPAFLRAHGAGVNVGGLHPVAVAVSYSAQQALTAAQLGTEGGPAARRHNTRCRS